jgi:chitodextrinase
VKKFLKKVYSAFMFMGITLILLNTFSIHSFAKSETMNYHFPMSTEQYRSETITIPGLVNITSVTVDTGNVAYSVSGNNVTITCRNGNYVDYDEESDYIYNYPYHSGNYYPPSRYYYSRNGYSGYIYLEYTENDGYRDFQEESKEFFKIQDNTRTDYYDSNGNFLYTTYSLGSPDNPIMHVHEDGYEGYIPKYSYETIQPRTRYDNPDGSYRYQTTWRAYYMGTLIKTVEIWHDDYTGYYSGMVYGNTTYFYAYNVTINYVTNSAPLVNIVSPTKNMIFNEASNSFVPVIAVSDPEGETLTCKVFIDSETSPRDTKTMSNTQTTQNVSFNALNLGNLSQGTHTMKFTVKDNEITQQATVSFKVDKTAPVLGSANVTSTKDAITITGSATDNMAMHDVPYRYYAGNNDSSWKTSTSHTFSNMSPNTQYQVKFIARDKVGHLSENIQNIYTKALKPIISVGNANETSLVVSCSENNPSGTQYLFSCGSQYVNAQGNLTSTPVWITPSGKSITVSGLSPNTDYAFTVKAKNEDGIETEASDAKSGKTLALPPQILEFPETKQN